MLHFADHPRGPSGRVFKTAWFARAARKAQIPDADLCTAIENLAKGQADDLGGGVFKKRLNQNRHRALILRAGRSGLFYAFLFAKKDRDNIDDEELRDFRRLAKAYGSLTDQQLARLLADGDLREICNEDKKEVQE